MGRTPGEATSAQRRPPMSERRQALRHAQRVRRGEAQAPAPVEAPQAERDLVTDEADSATTTLLKALGEELSGLMQDHVALVRREVQQSASVAVKQGIAIAVGAGALLLAYGFFNLWAIILVGALGGVWGAVWAAGVVTGLHAALGGVLVFVGLRRLRGWDPWGESATRAEIEKDVKWLKEIRDKAALPAPRQDQAS